VPEAVVRLLQFLEVRPRTQKTEETNFTNR